MWWEPSEKFFLEKCREEITIFDALGLAVEEVICRKYLVMPWYT